MLLRTTAALDEIRRFRSKESFDPFADALIESLCVRSVAVICISEVEEIISDRVKQRISTAIDHKVASFIAENLASIIKRTSKSDVAKTVRMFGDESAQRFNELISDQEVTLYQNVVSCRHEVAHADGGGISFEELESGVAVADRIVIGFDQCIA